MSWHKVARDGIDERVEQLGLEIGCHAEVVRAIKALSYLI